MRARYVEGLAAYRVRRWDEARRAFEAALEAVPSDEPSKSLIRRINDFVTTLRLRIGTVRGVSTINDRRWPISSLHPAMR